MIKVILPEILTFIKNLKLAGRMKFINKAEN